MDLGGRSAVAVGEDGYCGKKIVYLQKNSVMIVTIQIENQHDFQWLLPFLEAVKKNTTAKVEIKSSVADRAWEDKLNEFFTVIDKRAVLVPKVERLTREELNER